MNDPTTSSVSAEGLQSIRASREAAVNHAVDAFYRVHGPAYARFGEAGRRFCREDLAFHLDFLEAALEFGSAAPFVDYLGWLRSVLEARGIPAGNLMFSATLLKDFLDPLLNDADRASLAAIMDAAATALAAPAPAAISAPDPACAPMIDALLAGDSRGAAQLLDQSVEQTRDISGSEVGLVQGAMYDIGRAWQQNRVSVAEEHLATATAQTALARFAGSHAPADPCGKRALLACVEGNHHALGLRMVADAFEFAGWDVAYLGPNTPARFIADMAAKAPHDLIGLSATLPQHLRAAKEAIALLRAAPLPGKPRILLGGRAVNEFGAIAAALGADFVLGDAAACNRFALAEARA